MSNLTLYIPGLLGFSSDELYPDFVEPVSLTSILNQSERTGLTNSGYAHQVADLFGYVPERDRDIPAGAITRLIDDASRPEGYWMRADPVHLSPGSHGMTLFDASRLQLEQHEALALGATLQSLFKENDYELEVPAPDRWYVRMSHEVQLRTCDLYRARGHSIMNLMPEGEDHAHWLQLMNEVQMQLHGSDVNEAREQAGRLAVNSLWFWGSGYLPDILPRRWSTVYANDVLVQGYCMLSGTECRTPDVFLNDDRDDRKTSEDLVILDTALNHCDYHDTAGWHEYIRYLERQWFLPVTRLLDQKRIKQLTIITGTARFRFGKFHRLKFWKALGRFRNHLAGGDRRE